MLYTHTYLRGRQNVYSQKLPYIRGPEVKSLKSLGKFGVAFVWEPKPSQITVQWPHTASPVLYTEHDGFSTGERAIFSLASTKMWCFSFNCIYELKEPQPPPQPKRAHCTVKRILLGFDALHPFSLFYNSILSFIQV